jgi:hypothetical protein
MTQRAHHEAQIKRFDTTFGGELEDAITTLAFRIGLAWFTDDQIADIRETMMKTEFRRQRFNRENRARHTTIEHERTV